MLCVSDLLWTLLCPHIFLHCGCGGAGVQEALCVPQEVNGISPFCVFIFPVINYRNTLSDAGMAPNPQLIVQGSLCITQLDPRCSVSILVMASGSSQPQGRVSLLHWLFFKHI